MNWFNWYQWIHIWIMEMYISGLGWHLHCITLLQASGRAGSAGGTFCTSACRQGWSVGFLRLKSHGNLTLVIWDMTDITPKMALQYIHHLCPYAFAKYVELHHIRWRIWMWNHVVNVAKRQHLPTHVDARLIPLLCVKRKQLLKLRSLQYVVFEQYSAVNYRTDWWFGSSNDW